ncbi:DNA topoisomerase IB [Solimonas soli]|uniref:DNA topoisomerase IB n=1 Tax=Solimonas soli TaxID=413479 RepID=UPI0004BBD2F5|nr:DNA topoisomerase IB [Solimonas soli]
MKRAPRSAAAALPACLRYSSDREAGIRRVRAGKAFRYRDAQGRVIRKRAELARIAALAVPPAYRRVWICADPRGHLQATGYDARGRKQYRYHAGWRRLRDAQKFERMVEFARALPRLRRRLQQDLRRPGLPREKVLAAVVALLDRTRARIGNREYARDNGSYGLTTLRDRHARFERPGRLCLRFIGKGGAAHDLAIDDPQLARIVRRCQQLPGQTLFQYLDAEGRRHAVDSGQVNAYLHEAMGAEFTAKDFRTWGATLHAAALLGCTPRPARGGERALQRCVNEVVREVAAGLRNTPAVCRKSYINPLLFSIWRDGALDGAGLDAQGAPRQTERAVLRLLRRGASR